MSNFAYLGRTSLEAMAAHGREVVDCRESLARTGATVVGEVIRDAAGFYEWQHYPKGDVFDPATHAQYFYHAHPPDERGNEHGHFHTFLRARGIPAGVRPLVMPELAIADNPAAPAGPLVPSAPQSAAGDDADPWTHLIAIAMDGTGRPLRIFTTNRWVTGENWYTAADMTPFLDQFVLGPVPPSAILNRWITAMIGLFRPQIVNLLEARDATVMGWRRRRRGKVHVFDDRRLEVTSVCDIDVDRQMREIYEALRQVA